MKITRDDAVYVQKNDVAFLCHTDLEIPASIFLKLYSGGVTIINDSNRYEFVKFEEEDARKYLGTLDWMIEYDSVKDFNEEEFVKLGEDIIKLRNGIAKNYNSMSSSEREKNAQMVLSCELLDFKLCSLREVFLFKYGHINFNLPQEIEYDDESLKNSRKGIVSLLKRRKKSSNDKK